MFVCLIDFESVWVVSDRHRLQNDQIALPMWCVMICPHMLLYVVLYDTLLRRAEASHVSLQCAVLCNDVLSCAI